MVSRLRVCHDRSASQSKPSSAMVASRCTRPAAAYRSVSGGTGSSTNARRSANSASWIGPSPEANRSPAGIGTASNAACDSSSRTARSKPTLHRRDLGRGRRRRTLQRRPAQCAADHLDSRPPPDQPVEPTVRPQHHVGVAVVQHPAVRLQHTEATTSVVDELDVIADQPPAQRRQRRMHPHEPVGAVVGVDPHRPRRPLHQRRHEHEPVAHLGERRVQLQQPIQLVTTAAWTIPRLPEP